MEGLEGFVYPNEIEVRWSLLIVLYPYITGLVAGAFIVSSLYHVFGIKKLRPVGRFSLLMALAFLLVAPLPLVLHLGRPDRGIEIFLTPHFTSAMAGFGYIWLFYLLLLSSEVWLVFRKDIVLLAQTSTGIKKVIYSALALGVYDISERSLQKDAKIVKVLAAIGIPGAALLHGYVGFIFGAIKANPWWSTPLMPIIFLLSAIVSGIALLVVLYIVASKIRQSPLDHDCIGFLAKLLAGFLLLDIALGGLEMLYMVYESEESWEIISQLITQKLSLSYFGIQLALGSMIPLLVLGSVSLINLKEHVRTALVFLASFLVLIGIFAMRWNVVIGGQLFSKSLRGFLSYTPVLTGQEGILVALVLMILPLAIFAVMAHLIPPWQETAEAKPSPGRRQLARKKPALPFSI